MPWHQLLTYNFFGYVYMSLCFGFCNNEKMEKICKILIFLLRVLADVTFVIRTRKMWKKQKEED